MATHDNAQLPKLCGARMAAGFRGVGHGVSTVGIERRARGGWNVSVLSGEVVMSVLRAVMMRAAAVSAAIVREPGTLARRRAADVWRTGR